MNTAESARRFMIAGGSGLMTSREHRSSRDGAATTTTARSSGRAALEQLEPTPVPDLMEEYANQITCQRCLGLTRPAS